MSVLAFVDLAVQSRWPLFLLPLAVLLAYLGYRNTTPPLRGSERIPFVVLRALAFSLLFLILASPVLNRVRDEPLRARVAILVDESASMSTVDAESDGQDPRLQRAKDVITAVHAQLRHEDIEVEMVPFAAEVTGPLSPSSYLAQDREAAGPGTDLVGALQKTADRLAGQNLQSVLLLTDGRATRGGMDASALAGLGRPVYVIGIGDSMNARDLAIDRCEYGPIAYVESQASISVRVENSGFRGRSTLLRLLQDNRELFRQQLKFEQEYGRTQVDIPLELSTPGRQQLSLVLDPLEDEVTERNNSREIRIEVLKNKLRVLFVAARPDWDVAFLARTLREDPNVDLTLVHQADNGRWLRAETAEGFTLPTAPRDVQEYDLFILGSSARQPLDEFWNGIATAVERGRGLLVLPGRESLFSDERALQILGAVIPVQQTAQRGPQYRVEKVRLTVQGRLHPASSALLQIAGERQVLEKVPPLLAQHTALRSKPGALTLIETDHPQSVPVLTVARYGNGHTAAITGFPVWRWGFTEDERMRQANTEFLGHLVRWLTQPRDVKRVQITTVKPVYEGGEAVDFLAQVLDPQYEPLDDAELRLEVHRVDRKGETAGTLLLERKPSRPGEYAGTLAGLGPGEYEAEAVAERLGSVVGRDTTRFTVESYSVEFANTSQDVDFLRELAQRTGGEYGTVADAAALIGRMPRAPQPVILRSEIEIWNSSGFFVLFVVALAIEWLLRKRRGLL